MVRVEAPRQARGVAEEAGIREGLAEAGPVAAAAEAREAAKRRAPRQACARAPGRVFYREIGLAVRKALECKRQLESGLKNSPCTVTFTH